MFKVGLLAGDLPLIWKQIMKEQSFFFFVFEDLLCLKWDVNLSFQYKDFILPSPIL